AEILVCREFVAAGQERRSPGEKAAQCGAAGQDQAHRRTFGKRYQPVIIDRSSLNGPARTTIRIWTRKKATSSHATMKWIDRADCLPPNRSISHGQAAFMAGDMVRPVR